MSSSLDGNVPGVTAPTIRLSTVVMAHPSRRASADRLVAAHPDLRPQVVLDPDPTGPASPLRTAIAAWSEVPEDATHHLVLQDDVEGTRRLADHVHAAVQAVPDRPLVLFTEWGSRTAQMVRLATMLGLDWAEVPDRFHTSQAVVLPAPLVRDLVRHVETTRPGARGVTNDADVLFGFLRDRGAEPVVAALNLVEHVELPSLVGNSVLRGPRRSPCWDPDLPERRWGTAVLPIPAVLPYFATRDARSCCDVRTPEGATRQVQTVEWLGGLGHDPLELTRRFAAALSGADVERAQAHLGTTMLFELWVTALATGLVLADQLGTDGLHAAVESGPAARAWRTFVPGSMRKILPEAVGVVVGDELMPVVAGALRDGALLADRASTP